jgi:hypothetical protein
VFNILSNKVINTNYTFSVYSFTINTTTQAQFKYTGPPKIITIKNSNQSIFDSTALLTVSEKYSNEIQIFNFSLSGNYYILIHHNINSTN